MTTSAPPSKASSQADNSQILKRLVDGSRWLTNQHDLYSNDDPVAVNDTEFYKALDGWEKLEKQLRVQDGYQGCIFGSDEHCLQEAIITCAFCIAEPARAEPLVTQLGFLD